MPSMTEDTHAQANAEQIWLLREAVPELRENPLPPAAESLRKSPAGPEQVPPAAADERGPLVL